MAYTYILKSKNSGHYYVGSTINLNERIKHHLGGHTPSTSKMGELELVFYQKYETIKEARSVEHKLKKLKRHDYIEKIIKDGFIKIRS